MLLALLRHELRLALRARRVRVAGLAMAGLCGLAAYAGARAHLVRGEEHRDLVETAEASFSEQRPDHPHTIAHQGYVVSRPPASLGYLDAGVDLAYGRWLRLDAHQTRPLAGARVSSLTRGPGAGRFDLGLLLAVFAPLVVVLLGYDRVAGERRRGTLAMLATAGLEPLPLAGAKLAGLGARIGLAVILPAAAAAVVASLAVDAFDGARLGVWLALHVAALAVWAVLVLVVSAGAPSVSVALVRGVALWAALALTLPPFAGGLSRWLAPVPPPGEALMRAAEWAESAHAQTEALRDEARRVVRKRHPEWDGTGEPPEVLDAVMLELADRDAAEKMRGLLAHLEAEQNRQERWAVALSLTSPSGLASLASSALAGSDLGHHRAVFRHYEQARIELMAWFNRWWAREGTGGFDRFDDERRFDAFEAAPRPSVPTFSLGFAMKRAVNPTVALAALLAVATAGLVFVSRRALCAPKGSR